LCPFSPGVLFPLCEHVVYRVRSTERYSEVSMSEDVSDVGGFFTYICENRPYLSWVCAAPFSGCA
jgi:hypothetical protein